MCRVQTVSSAVESATLASSPFQPGGSPRHMITASARSAAARASLNSSRSDACKLAPLGVQATRARSTSRGCLPEESSTATASRSSCPEHVDASPRRPDDRQAPRYSAQWQQAAFVLQQHDALARDLAGPLRGAHRCRSLVRDGRVWHHLRRVEHPQPEPGCEQPHQRRIDLRLSVIILLHGVGEARCTSRRSSGRIRFLQPAAADSAAMRSPCDGRVGRRWLRSPRPRIPQSPTRPAVCPAAASCWRSTARRSAVVAPITE